MATITVSPDYGFVVAVAIASCLLVFFFGAKVTSYRKIAQVPLPFLYADANECKEDHKKLIFNCYQRIHQNTLEGFTTYLVMLLLAGLEYPIASAALGGVWCVGRYLYYYGYSSGHPNSRKLGAFGHLGWLGLLGLAGKMAFDLIKSRP
ncbi:Microsomal glutathione S-transferase 3 [Linnemannia elongata]|nr:Microsomal glutathione S-transferase 3 [Linnemannia elongata]KAG0060323.1 Microsomal glutathione S-transferase 3 [Linnemannia elongata]